MILRARGLIGLLTVVGSVVTLALASAPASGERLTLRDARRDVWVYSDASTAVPAPGVRAGDVTKVVVSHSRRVVEVRVRLVVLRKEGPYGQYAVTVQARQGKVRRQLLLEASRRHRGGSLRLFNAAGSEVSCDARHDIDYRRDQISVRLDRRCLNSPKAVRVNVTTARATGKGVFYSDNAHDTGAASSAWSAWVRNG